MDDFQESCEDIQGIELMVMNAIDKAVQKNVDRVKKQLGNLEEKTATAIHDADLAKQYSRKAIKEAECLLLSPAAEKMMQELRQTIDRTYQICNLYKQYSPAHSEEVHKNLLLATERAEDVHKSISTEVEDKIKAYYAIKRLPDAEAVSVTPDRWTCSACGTVCGRMNLFSMCGQNDWKLTPVYCPGCGAENKSYSGYDPRFIVKKKAGRRK